MRFNLLTKRIIKLFMILEILAYGELQLSISLGERSGGSPINKYLSLPLEICHLSGTSVYCLFSLLQN